MLLLFVCGTTAGWTSPYVAKLTAPDSPLPITLDQASWVASLVTFGRFMGPIPGAVSVSYFGGKMTMIIVGVPMIISWICMIAADTVVWLYVSRLISGVGVGMAFSSFPLFLGEISSTEIRGTLVSFAVSGLSIGNLFGNIIGPYVSMAVFAYICLVPTVTFILIFIWLPESPHHLVRRDKMEAAKKSIARYNPGAKADVEVNALKNFINANDSLTFFDKLKEFNIPANRKAGIIVILLFMFPQFSGINSIVFYMETILTNGGWTMTAPSLMVIVVSTIGILSGFVTVYVADKYGRKTLIIGSSLGVSLCLIFLGLHFALLKDGFDPAKLQWFILTLLVFYKIVYWLGLCTVPNVVCSELFAPNIKSIAASCGSMSLGLSSFVATKAWQPLHDAIGMDYLFYLHAALMMVAIVFFITIMPETKGKSLQEIQNMIHKKYIPVKQHDCETEDC